MKHNFVKTTVKKLSELSWPDLHDLFGWSSSGSTIQAENGNLLVAKAANDKGEVVAYVTAENILLVDSYVFNPTINPMDVQKAGDGIDAALAQRAGVSRMLIAIPDDAPPMKGEKCLRVFERRVFNTPKIGVKELSDDGSTIEKRFSVDPRTNSAKFYLN